jgi:hypothetical protein
VAEFENAFAIDVADDRNDKAIRRIDSNANVVVAL